jgi:hypothetical protein
MFFIEFSWVTGEISNWQLFSKEIIMSAAVLKMVPL